MQTDLSTPGDRLRLPFQFDPALLQRDLQLLSESQWIAHFVKQNYEGNWSVIPLRGKKGATHPVMMIYPDPTCKEFEDTPFLEPCAYFKKVIAEFKCEVQAVRLMSLAPGSVIKEHKDHDLCFEDGKARIHIPVVTNPDVEFYLNGQRVVLDEGSCWYLRLADPHRVLNKGASSRVHLVIDTVVNDWMKNLFVKSLAGQFKVWS